MEFIKVKLQNLGVKAFGVRIEDHFVDKDLDSMFFPLHLMQKVLLNPKYILKKNFIKPNNILFKLLSVIMTAMLSFVFLYRVHDLSYNTVVLVNIPTMYYLAYFDLIFYSIGFITISIVNVFNSKRNIKFLLKIQDLLRAINNDISSKYFITWNWIYVIVNIFFSLISSICICGLLQLPIYMYFCCLSLILFDATMVYAIRMVALLADKANLWADKAKNVILHRFDSNYNDDSCEAMLNAFKHILESYEMYKSCFQPMILFNIVHSFCHILIYVQISVEGLKFFASQSNYLPHDPEFSTTAAFVILFNNTSWASKILVTQVLLSRNFEAFYSAMYNTQDVCAIILNSNCTDAEKRLCKNVQRLYKVEFDKMYVCRVMHIDASLPPTQIELTSNYTIALLQFALL